MEKGEENESKEEPVKQRLSDLFRKNSKEITPEKEVFEPQVIEEFNPESPSLIQQ
jgi:hypothetical protein